MIKSSLEKNTLFDGVSDNDFSKLIEEAEVISLIEGKILFRRGQELNKIYFVQSGEINHFVEKIPGQTTVVVYQNYDLILPPEYAESDLLKSTAIAVRDTYLIEIPKTSFIRLESQNPDVARKAKALIENLSGRNFEQPSIFGKAPETSSAVLEAGKLSENTQADKAYAENDTLNIIKPSDKYSVQFVDNAYLITIHLTEATFGSAAGIKKLLLQIIENEPADIIVDLSEAQMIDSTFLGALVIGLKKTAANNNRFILVSSNKPAWMIFEMTGLANVFTSFNSLEEAKQFITE